MALDAACLTSPFHPLRECGLRPAGQSAMLMICTYATDRAAVFRFLHVCHANLA
jgi:hypothetical protein